MMDAHSSAMGGFYTAWNPDEGFSGAWAWV